MEKIGRLPYPPKKCRRQYSSHLDLIATILCEMFGGTFREANKTGHHEGVGGQGYPSAAGSRAKISLLIKVLTIVMVLALAWGCSMKAAKPANELPSGMSSLVEAEKAVQDFEALESSGQVFFAAPPEMRGEKVNQAVARLEKTNEEVDGYLKKSPGDPTALLLKARILRALDKATPKVFSAGPEGKPGISGSSHLPDIQKILDEVLAKDPGNAAAHYWKARMCALQEPVIEEGKFGYKEGDIEKVVLHAGKAVELAPDNLVCREYYAQVLLATGRAEESMDLMKNVSGGNHPIYRLQKDWQLIPFPESAIVDPIMTMSLIRMYMASEERGIYPTLRMAAFFLPESAEEVVAFFSSRFGTLKQRKDLKQESGTFPIALAWKGEELVQIESTASDDPDFSGVMIMVCEMEEVTPYEQEICQIPEGGKVCMMIVNNTRKFKEP